MKIILSQSQFDEMQLQSDDPSIPPKIKQSIEIIKTFAGIDKITATKNSDRFDITLIVKGTMLHREELQKIATIPEELNCAIGPVFSGEAHKWLICLWNH